MRRLLLIDAKAGVSDLVQRVFDATEIDLAQTDSFEQGLRLLREIKPEVVIMGLDSSDTSNLDALRGIGEVDPRVPVIVVESTESDPNFPPDLKTAVFDRLQASTDPADLIRSMQIALSTVGHAKACASYGAPAQLRPGEEMVVGHDAAMKAVFKKLERLAHSDSFALITGEIGTGKKLIARSIHQRSRRRDGFLIVIDCSDPRELLDRELFGDKQRKSRLELASGGTLVLHHIHRMPLVIQTKLLIWLQENARRSTAPQTRFTAARLIASSATPLEQEVAERTFREDLRRLFNVVQLDLPPLRDRLDDLPDLTAYFLNRFASEKGHAPKSLSAVVSKTFAAYWWPENVRELENTLQRANEFAMAETIELGDLPGPFLTTVGPALVDPQAGSRNANPNQGGELADLPALSRALFRWARRDPQFRIIPAIERGLIIQAMAETEGNQARAALLLGITRATLRKRLHRFNIQREVFIH